MADFPSEGPAITQFLRQFCRHPRGTEAGKPVVVVPEQQAVMDELFRTDEDTGLWSHREALVMVHRKWAKTLITSGASLFALITKSMGTEIYLAANSRTQAGILKKNVDMFANSSPVLRKRLWVYRNKIETPTGSHMMVLGADAHQAHGYNPQLSVIDEYWGFRRNDLPEALASGAAAREESMTLYITTPGVDLNTPLGQLLERHRRGDPTLYVHFPGQHVPMDVDVYDEAAWSEFNIGYRHGWISKQFLVSQAHSLPRHEFVRLHLGGWLQSSAGWIDLGKFDKCRGNIVLEPGADMVVFIDGAWKHDSVAIVACVLKPRPEIHVLKVWEKPVGDDSWRVPYYEIDGLMRDIVNRYNVRKIGADPFFLGQMLQTWFDAGLPVQEIPTNSVGRAVDACKRFYDAVVEERIWWDSNPILRRHMGNCVPKQDARGIRVSADRTNPLAKIDCAIAAIFAHDMATKIAAEPKLWMY